MTSKTQPNKKNAPLSDKFEEVKLVYYNKVKAADRLKIKTKETAYEALISCWDMGQISLVEEFKLLFLDRSMGLMSYANLAKGGIDAVYLDKRIAFAMALKRRATSIILAHNHPSGNVRPSHADIRMTKDFVQAGQLLGIEVNDHIIVTEDAYYSMCYEGDI